MVMGILLPPTPRHQLRYVSLADIGQRSGFAEIFHQPRKIGFLPAWLLGLAMDVADGSLFGQHALAYSVMMFAAIALHRRVSMFDMRHQILHILPILLIMQLIGLGVREAAGGEFPGWWYFLASITSALLWPVTDLLLKIPLRQRPDPDGA
jgi:rod shape-determining protein MreD